MVGSNTLIRSLKVQSTDIAHSEHLSKMKYISYQMYPDLHPFLPIDMFRSLSHQTDSDHDLTTASYPTRPPRQPAANISPFDAFSIYAIFSNKHFSFNKQNKRPLLLNKAKWLLPSGRSGVVGFAQ